MQQRKGDTSTPAELTSLPPESAAADNGAAATGAAETSAEHATSIEELLRQAELNAAEHHDAWLRAKAETENVRKRALADVASARKYALESFSGELLTVKDSLEAALAVKNATVESYRAGMELTLRQLGTVFEKFGITEINPLNEKFDPHKHQAITTVESDAPASTVVKVMQKGYMLHDRVLRPALVAVSQAKNEA